MADAAALIVVLVSLGESASPTTRAMTRAMRDALGPATQVTVRETTADPSDADAAAVERQEHPDVVVELSWADAQRRQATLRVRMARAHRWLDRTFAFRPSDADAERGRTLGFAVASVLPEEEAAPSEGESPSPKSSASPATGGPPPATAAAPPAPAAETGSSAPVAPHATAPAPTPPSPSAPATPTPPAPSSTPAPSTAAPRTATPPPAAPEKVGPVPPVDVEESEHTRGAVDVVASATAASSFEGVGAEAAVQWFAVPSAPWLSLRVSAGVRFGHTEPSSGGAALPAFPWTNALGSVGLSVHALRPSRRVPFGISVRAEAWAAYAWVSTPSSERAAAARNPGSGGPEAVAEIAWRFASPVEAVVGAGAAYAIFPATLTVDGHAATLFPQWRGVAEAGIRTSF